MLGQEKSEGVPVKLGHYPNIKLRVERQRREDNGKIPVGERAILKACAEYANGADKTQLTVLTGYKRSTRDAYIQRLREKGFVGERGQQVYATDIGFEALGDFDPLPTGTALRDHWLSKLPSGERRILEVLVNANAPHNVSRDEIDTATGFKRSTRDAYLQRLEAKKIVEFMDRGTVRASALLWD